VGRERESPHAGQTTRGDVHIIATDDVEAQLNSDHAVLQREDTLVTLRQDQVCRLVKAFHETLWEKRCVGRGIGEGRGETDDGILQGVVLMVEEGASVLDKNGLFCLGREHDTGRQGPERERACLTKTFLFVVSGNEHLNTGMRSGPEGEHETEKGGASVPEEKPNYLLVTSSRRISNHNHRTRRRGPEGEHDQKEREGRACLRNFVRSIAREGRVERALPQRSLFF
jgi:hypothetical protein